MHNMGSNLQEHLNYNLEIAFSSTVIVLMIASYCVFFYGQINKDKEIMIGGMIMCLASGCFALASYFMLFLMGVK